MREQVLKRMKREIEAQRKLESREEEMILSLKKTQARESKMYESLE